MFLRVRFCDFCGIFIGFCKFVDSALDSTNPQNPHKKHKMDGRIVWLIRVGKVKRILLFAYPKSRIPHPFKDSNPPNDAILQKSIKKSIKKSTLDSAICPKIKEAKFYIFSHFWYFCIDYV